MTTYHYAPPAIDFSTFPEDDGQPMAETEANGIQMTNLIYAFEHVLAPRERVKVGGNLLMYYNPESGWDHVSPDVYVAFDADPGMRRKWQTWLEGKFPEIVFEITSESTVKEDLGTKVELYARLGVREYYLFDPQREMEPRFRGFYRSGSRLQPISIVDERIVSPLMGVELRAMGEWLRVIDPLTGEPVPDPDEAWRLWHEEEQARLAAEQRAEEALQAQSAAEQAQQVAEQARQMAEQRATAEERARLAAEDRLQAALAELERLRRGEAGAPPTP
jgi:Uma2 family endonuclease